MKTQIMPIDVFKMPVIYTILPMSIKANILIHLHKLNHSTNLGAGIKMNFVGEHFGFTVLLVKTITWILPGVTTRIV